MKERIINKLNLTRRLRQLLVLFTFALLPMGAWAQTFSGGTGTSGDPYIIKTTDDLTYLAGHVNDGSLDTDGMYFKMDDGQLINCENLHQFAPIGTYDHPFKGTFDGVSINMYIGNLSCNLNSSEGYNGLFGVIDGGTVKNLKLASCSFTGGDCVGAIVGCLKDGVIDNCMVTSCTMASGNAQNVAVGGIAGKVQKGTIQNCKVYLKSITASTTYSTDEGASYAGGIVGFIDGTGDASILSNEVLNGTSPYTILSSHDKPDIVCAGGVVGYCLPTLSNISVKENRVKGDAAIKGVAGVLPPFTAILVGAIAGGAKAGHSLDGVLQNNYYDYTVKTSTKSGNNDEVVKTGYEYRATTGESSQVGVYEYQEIFDYDGAVLYNTKALTLPPDVDNTVLYSCTPFYRESNGQYYVVSGREVAVEVMPQNGFVPVGYIVKYTPEGGTEQTITPTPSLDNQSGHYFYTFTMPNAAATVESAVGYPIKIGTTQLTSANMNTGAFEGISYDATQNQLTLSNVTLTVPITWDGNYNDYGASGNNLTIVLKGSNTITTTGTQSCLIMNRETTGYTNGVELTFIGSPANNSSLTLTCNKGIDPFPHDSQEELKPISSQFYNSTFYDNANKTDNHLMGVTWAREDGASTVTYKFDAYYGFIVAGVPVTEANRTGVTGTNITGSVTYDTTTGALVLENAVITGPIYCEKDYVHNYESSIVIKGSNSIQCTSAPCIFGSDDGQGSFAYIKFLKDATYTGESWLSLSSDNNLLAGFRLTNNEPRLDGFSWFSGANNTATVATDYKLNVAGLDITSANASAIHLATPTTITVATGGSVSFDNSNKTLTLKNATLGTTTNKVGDVVWYGDNDLKIKLYGDNSIVSNGASISSNSLTATPNLSLERGDANSECSLTLNSGEICVSFNNFDANTLTPGAGMLAEGLNWYAESALKARISTDYGLTIAGQKISATNNAATGITGTGITGKVTYNPSTKTLTLDNATIEYEQGAAIVWESTEALTVDLVGNNTIDSRNSNGGQLAFQGYNGNLTFTTSTTSPGSLLMMSEKDPFKENTFYTGFAQVSNATTNLNSVAKGESGSLWREVTISYHYPLKVYNIQVTSANAGNIRGNYTAPTATYEHTSDGKDILTFTDGINYDMTGGNKVDYVGVESGFENLYVRLQGDLSEMACKGTNDIAFKGTVANAKVIFTTDAASSGSWSIAAHDGQMFVNITPEYDGLMYFDKGTKSYYNDVTQSDHELVTCRIMKSPWEGSGTAGDPFLIKTADELMAVASNMGNIGVQSFRLDDNIDLSQVPNFSPIGEYSGSPFVGTFDGDHHIISGLSYVQAATQWAIGLFGYIGEEPGNNSVAGTVKNLVLENCEFGSGDDVGAIAYCLRNGTIDNCTVKSCTVTGGDAQDAIAGGIAGTVNSGTISNCTVNGTTSVGAYTAGAIYGSTVANGSAPTLSTNYYYYTVQVTDGNGLKKDYAERGIGEQADGDGALLYTRPVSVSGLSKADGDGWEVVNFYAPSTVPNNGVYSLAPGTTASLEITPRADYVPTTVSLAYGSQTDNLANTSTAGGYTYGFEVPDADATVNVALAVDLTSTSFTYEIAGTDYNGSAVVPATVTMKKSGTAVTPFTKDTHFTIEGYKDSNSNALSGAPTDAGTYFATIKGVLAGGYAGTKDVQFVINKAANAFTTAPVGAANLTYNGGEQALITTAGAASFGDVVYSLTADGTFGAANTIKATDAKTYTIYYKVEGTNNYDGIAASSIQVAIAQAAISSVTLDKTELVYQLNTQQTVTVAKVMAGTLEVPADYYTVSGNTGTDEGSYTLVVTARTDIANNFKGSASATWTITKHVATETELGFATTTQDYASFYSETEDLYLPDGFVAYIVTATDNTSVTTQRISYVPKGVAVLIERGSSTETAIDQPTGNMLHGTTVPTNVADISGGTVYVLYNGEFVRCTEGTIPAGRCYLLVPSGSNARRLTIGHGDDTTGVQYYRTYSDMNGEQWYDMQGRKIDKPTKAGLYILNGRKVVVRNHQVVNNK